MSKFEHTVLIWWEARVVGAGRGGGGGGWEGDRKVCSSGVCLHKGASFGTIR